MKDRDPRGQISLFDDADYDGLGIANCDTDEAADIQLENGKPLLPRLVNGHLRTTVHLYDKAFGPGVEVVIVLAFAGSRFLRGLADPRHVTTMLECWSALLPAHVVKEDLGDYIEDINQRIANGQRKLVYVRVLAAMFWTGLNTAAFFVQKLREIVRPRSA